MVTSPAFRAKPRDVKIAEVGNIIGEVYDFPELSKRTLGRECLETSYAVQARLDDSGTPID